MKKERRVSASEAAKNFGHLVDRVRSERAVYIVERSGSPVVRIEPVDIVRCTVADLSDWFNGRGPLDAAFVDEVEGAVNAFNTPTVPGDPWAR
jgi:prevent-host-death family protein